MLFPKMIINNINTDGDSASVDIGYVIIQKNMDDAQQDTLWHGKGILTIDNLVIDCDDLPPFPATVTSADIKDNQITYRDEVAIPIQYYGNVGLTLYCEGFKTPLKFIGEQMNFNVSEHEKYIKHLS